MARETVFLGFGSNVGDRLDYCNRAITLLTLLPHSEVTGVSSLYETEPLADRGDPGPGWFLNGVVRMDTDVVPRSLLAVCREIESALGRDHAHRGEPRTLDLDILLYGARRLDETDLIVPHPRLHRRRFVLVPLAELAPDLVHPTLNRPIRDLLADVPDHTCVRLFSPPPSREFGSRSSCSVLADGDPGRCA